MHNTYDIYTNKIELNVAKAEIILFKTSNENYDENSKLSSTEKEFMHPSMLNISAFLSMKRKMENSYKRNFN